MRGKQITCLRLGRPSHVYTDPGREHGGDSSFIIVQREMAAAGVGVGHAYEHEEKSDGTRVAVLVNLVVLHAARLVRGMLIANNMRGGQ